MDKRITYEESVRIFISSKKNGIIFGEKRIEQKHIKEILLGKTDKIKKEYKYKLDSEWTRLTLEDIIISQKGNRKKMAYFVCCKYIEFINSRDFGIKLEKLPPFYNEMERRIELCKKMHSEFHKEEVGREFFVTSRTIETDLSQLKYGEMSVMGQTLKVDYNYMRKHKINMLSTAHPLFLVQNLTQIVAMLNGLLYVSKNDLNYGENAENTAIDIWMQLSEYAQNRILGELIQSLDLDEEWYKNISKKANDRKAKLQDERLSEEVGHFKNEIEASRNNKYLYILKNQEPCIVTYSDEYGEDVEIYADYIKASKKTIIICVNDEEEIELPLEDIKSFKALPKR